MSNLELKWIIKDYLKERTNPKNSKEAVTFRNTPPELLAYLVNKQAELWANQKNTDLTNPKDEYWANQKDEFWAHLNAEFWVHLEDEFWPNLKNRVLEYRRDKDRAIREHEFLYRFSSWTKKVIEVYLSLFGKSGISTNFSTNSCKYKSSFKQPRDNNKSKHDDSSFLLEKGIVFYDNHKDYSLKETSNQNDTINKLPETNPSFKQARDSNDSIDEQDRLSYLCDKKFKHGDSYNLLEMAIVLSDNFKDYFLKETSNQNDTINMLNEPNPSSQPVLPNPDDNIDVNQELSFQIADDNQPQNEATFLRGWEEIDRLFNSN